MHKAGNWPFAAGAAVKDWSEMATTLRLCHITVTWPSTTLIRHPRLSLKGDTTHHNIMV